MPSIVVLPSVVESAGGPVIAGVEFKRPSSRSVSWEPVVSTQELGNGNMRSYYKGKRQVVALGFSKLTEQEVDALVAVLAAPVVTYAEDTDATPVVMFSDDAVAFEAIAGTFPVRHNASLTLKARDLVR